VRQSWTVTQVLNFLGVHAKSGYNPKHAFNDPLGSEEVLAKYMDVLIQRAIKFVLPGRLRECDALILESEIASAK